MPSALAGIGTDRGHKQADAAEVQGAMLLVAALSISRLNQAISLDIIFLLLL